MEGRDPLPETRRGDRRDDAPARHDRRDRARHRTPDGLPGLAALPRPADPAARRPEGVDRVDPPDRGGPHGSASCSGSRSWRSATTATAGLLWPSIGAVALVGFQAWLGRETVRLNNSGESVTAHLAAAMALVGCSCYPRPVVLPGPHRRPRREPAVHARRGAGGAVGVRAAAVRVAGHRNQPVVRLPDWPLMNGSLLPALTTRTRPTPPPLGRDRRRADRGRRRVLALRTQRDNPPVLRLAMVGGGPVPDPGGDRRPADPDRPVRLSQTLHLALGAVIWALLAALVFVSYYSAASRSARRAGSGTTDSGAARTASSASRRGPGRLAAGLHRADEAADHRAAARDDGAGDGPRDARGARDRARPWAWLTVWTLIGGTLAAGSANAINCYLDRDIDELMVRTRRRPLPAHQVDPERAVVFGVALGVVSFAGPDLVREPARSVPRAARDRVLRRRLHDRDEADDAAEHRHRRRGRRCRR